MSLENIQKQFKESIPQIILIIVAAIWLLCSTWITGKDIVTGELEHKALSYSFIVGILMTGYIVTKNQLSKSKRPRKKKDTSQKIGGCSKCGKNKTKK